MSVFWRGMLCGAVAVWVVLASCNHPCHLGHIGASLYAVCGK